MIRKALLALTALLLLAGNLVFASDYRIENVKGNVYRFIDDRHRSVFLMTKAGILITEPLNANAAR